VDFFFLFSLFGFEKKNLFLVVVSFTLPFNFSGSKCVPEDIFFIFFCLVVNIYSESFICVSLNSTLLLASISPIYSSFKFYLIGLPCLYVSLFRR